MNFPITASKPEIKEAFRVFPDDEANYSASAMRHAFITGYQFRNKLERESPTDAEHVGGSK